MKATSRRQAAANIYIGTSGFSYKDWRNGIFYPPGLPQGQWFEYYVSQFNTVELNVTFYRLPSENAFKAWYKRSPNGFVFAVKGSRFITHVKRLKDAEDPLRLFWQGARLLKEKLSIILWQLPPRMKADQKRLAQFVRIAKRICGRGRIRHAFEFRDSSWFCKEITSVLEDQNVARCQADWPDCSKKYAVTSDFMYIRRHGQGTSRYSGCYSTEDLKKDARKIRSFVKQGRDVYVFFNNDIQGHAPRNALELKELL